MSCSPLSPLLAILLTLFHAGNLLRGQEGQIRHDATTLIVPAGSHTLKTLVDASAACLQINIMFNEQELSSGQPITLQTPLAIDRAAAEETVSELLFARGFVLVPCNANRTIHELIMLNGPRGHEVMHRCAPKTPAAILEQPHLKQPTSTTVQLTNINANIACNALRPFFAQAGGTGMLMIGTAGDNTSLLLSGMQSEVARAITFVREVDVAAPPAAAATPPAAANDAIAPIEQRIAELERAVAELRLQLARLQSGAGGK